MDEEPVDFKKTINFVRRIAWLLILGFLIGAVLGFLGSTIIKPVYQATTRIMMTRAGQVHSSDFTVYLSDLQLTQTYAQLLGTQTTFNAASSRLGFEVKPDDVDIRVVQDTQIIVLTASNHDPQQAALIANQMIEVLMEQNEIILSTHYDALEKSLKGQKTQIEEEILNLQQQIENTGLNTQTEQKKWLEDQLVNLEARKESLQLEILQLGTPDTLEKRLFLIEKNNELEQVISLGDLYQTSYNNLISVLGKPGQDYSAVANSQIALLSSTRALYQQYYVTVLDELESVHLARLQNIPNIVQIEVATPLEEPVFPIFWLNTILGSMFGFILVLGISIIRDSLNDTLRTPEEVEQTLGVPVLGFIPEIQKSKTGSKGICVMDDFHSPIAEAFRSLRSELIQVSGQTEIHTLLIASPQPDEGKTTVAINLAASFSQMDKSVTLLDADMRYPRISCLLKIPNDIGISDLYSEKVDLQKAINTMKILPKLKVITSGELPVEPLELLDSQKTNEILADIKSLSELVIIDSSRLMTDSRILAGKVDAVLLVIQPGVTHADAARSTMDMFQRAGARILGVVMNRIPRNRLDYYGGYKYLSPYIYDVGRYSKN